MSSLKPAKQIVDGILLLDKPLHLSSNNALQQVKRLYNAQKAGHTGSLDPLATGMLPLCFGEATKFSQYLLDADKHYVVTAKLGEKTTTGDLEGEIVAQHSVPDLSDSQLEAVLTKFRSAIEQVPSMFSAIKHQGTPLYEYARKGITIERPARVIHIHALTVIERTSDTLTLDVKCTKGTYIRTLVEDIGEALGCSAHVIALRRLAVAGYQAATMYTLAELEQRVTTQGVAALIELLLPAHTAVQHWPTLQLSQAAFFYLRRGQPLLVPYAPAAGWVTLLIEKQFVGIGEILADGKVAPRRLVAAEKFSS